MGEIVLDIDSVDKTFGGLHALADINLKVEEGTTHAIIGPNGAASRRCSMSALAVLCRIPAR